jgi:hypothetical protein
MPKRTMSVERHYTEGRHHPYGRSTDENADSSIRRHPSTESGNARGAFNSDRPQDPIDYHDVPYANDHANDWVRGRGEDATGKPSFDRGNSWRLGRERSLNWNSGSDPARLRKPVGET